MEGVHLDKGARVAFHVYAPRTRSAKPLKGVFSIRFEMFNRFRETEVAEGTAL